MDSFIYSARSRVRGTLEVYHAFIRDLDASDASSTTNNEPDWELVNDGESEADIESAAHTQVSVQLVSVCVPSNRMHFNFILLFVQKQNAYGTSSVAEPLPTGWEERQDANGMPFQMNSFNRFPFARITQVYLNNKTGRTYYVNHIARTTQWERPTVHTQSAPSSTDIDNAAMEFERRFHISVDASEDREQQVIQEKKPP